jgi:hypothetical protein
MRSLARGIGPAPRQPTSANATSGGNHYDHNLNHRLFVFGAGDFSANALQDLDLRFIVGGGFGWHVAKSNNKSFDLLGGVVWTHESYSATTGAPAITNSFPALNLGEQYKHNIGASSLLSEQAFMAG